MGKLMLILIIAIALSACGKTNIKTEYRYVNKPVLVCPSPQDLNGGVPIPGNPVLAIYSLDENSTDGEIARAYEITVRQLQGHVDILREIVNSYDRTSQEYKNLKKVMDTLYPENSVVKAPN